MVGSSWLTVHAGDVPSSDGWLSEREQGVLDELALPRRRSDWRLGRWAAKRALLAADASLAGADPATVEIHAAPDGAPEAWVDGVPSRLAVSLSHRGGRGACLVAARGTDVGCDLELIEPRAPVFAADWFTPGELLLVETAPPEQRDLLVTLVWSAKESALKAVRQGLRLDTRDMEVRLPGHADAELEGWRPLAVRYRARELSGWWRVDGRWVMTVVADPVDGPPAELERVSERRKERLTCR